MTEKPEHPPRLDFELPVAALETALRILAKAGHLRANISMDSHMVHSWRPDYLHEKVFDDLARAMVRPLTEAALHSESVEINGIDQTIEQNLRYIFTADVVVIKPADVEVIIKVLRKLIQERNSNRLTRALAPEEITT